MSPDAWAPDLALAVSFAFTLVMWWRAVKEDRTREARAAYERGRRDALHGVPRPLPDRPSTLDWSRDSDREREQ